MILTHEKRFNIVLHLVVSFLNMLYEFYRIMKQMSLDMPLLEHQPDLSIHRGFRLLSISMIFQSLCIRLLTYMAGSAN
jgi:hypothetical protein